MSSAADPLIAADKAHCWHPFTQMLEWCALDHVPIMLVAGEGAILKDSSGQQYIDGNSSIWTNLHGHNHPHLNAALREQLDRVAHTSFLGFTNPKAAELAQKLVALFGHKLQRVFFSDNGSTAIEVALKMAAQYWQLKGQPERHRFAAFVNAYHGDTMGASSLGGVKIFHERFAPFQFPVQHVESVDQLDPSGLAAVVIEPLIQGAAGMRTWKPGLLSQLRAWCDDHGVFLIADEVMTGFGRTGRMFACEHEGVIPDFLALAKGLTGGYMPLAATLTSERVFEAFLGSYEEQKTLYYGHSYTANQLGCAVALANLEIFENEQIIHKLQTKIALLAELLEPLKALPNVSEVRQCGFIAGIELVQSDGSPWDRRLQMGAKVCLAAREYGLLTRPIRDVIALVPPYCITENQIRHMVAAVSTAIGKVCV